MKQKVFVLLSLMACMGLLGGCANGGGQSQSPANESAVAAEEPSSPHAPAGIVGITAITEVYPDGQKITAAAVEYGDIIDSTALSASAFAVTDRTITGIYTNAEPSTSPTGTEGCYVILELSLEDAGASVLRMGGGGSGMGGGPGGGEGPGSSGGPNNDREGPSGDRDGRSQEQEDGGPGGEGFADRTGGMGGGQGGARGGGTASRAEVRLSVAQIADIVSAQGTVYPANAESHGSDAVVNLVVDDFVQLQFADPDTGVVVNYNLFVPENYDESIAYPLVMFIHDAGNVSEEIDMTLIQGIGGVIWATPEEQAKHPGFVLAPQFSTTTVDNEGTADLDATVALIHSLTEQYSIDTDRIYATGQSMGCMSSLAMNIKYPDLFAASLLVAGQWDAQATSVLTDHKMWILVSQGDERAYPGMNESVAVWENGGTAVSKAVWNARAGEAELAAAVGEMIAQGNHINYTVFEGSTVVPEGIQANAANNHTSTWQVAFGIEGVRDWLFEQSK